MDTGFVGEGIFAGRRPSPGRVQTDAAMRTEKLAMTEVFWCGSARAGEAVMTGFLRL